MHQCKGCFFADSPGIGCFRQVRKGSFDRPLRILPKTTACTLAEEQKVAAQWDNYDKIELLRYVHDHRSHPQDKAWLRDIYTSLSEHPEKQAELLTLVKSIYTKHFEEGTDWFEDIQAARTESWNAVKQFLVKELDIL